MRLHSQLNLRNYMRMTDPSSSLSKHVSYELQWRIQEAPPLFLDQTEARRAEKRFFGDRPPPPAPPPTSSRGLHPALHYIKLSVSAFFKFAHPRLLLYFLCCLSLCVIF